MKKKIALILVLTAVVVIAACMSVATVFADADDTVKIYVHFYNGDGQYDYDVWEGRTNIQWGSYYWIDTGRVSVNYTTEADPDEDPDKGGFSRDMGGGSVNPATGEFNFAVEEGYRIRGGKLAEPVRGASLIGKGPEILPLISMVGDDLELASGICGASSGLVPVTVGQPTIKVDSILVGGR